MLSLVCAALLASSPSHHVRVSSAVGRARHEVPTAEWSGERALVADFTFDGVPDVALLGVGPLGVTVVVVVGPISPGARVLSLRFAADPDAQDGICGSPREARIEVEPPAMAEECAASDAACSALAERLRAASEEGGKGLALTNDGCDRFHIVFDGARLVWTRL